MLGTQFVISPKQSSPRLLVIYPALLLEFVSTCISIKKNKNNNF